MTDLLTTALEWLLGLVIVGLVIAIVVMWVLKAKKTIEQKFNKKKDNNFFKNL